MTAIDSLTTQAVEILVERVEEQFDEGVDNLSRAITNVVVPQTIGEDRYNENRTSFEFDQMVLLYLYRRVRGFSQREVITKLERQAYLKQRFGFDEKIPTPQTLSNTENADNECGRFTPETKTALDIAAKAIALEADERRIIVEELAPALLRVEEDEDEEESLREYKRTRATKSVRLARRHAIPHFGTSRAENKTYSDQAIFDVLARMCATTGSSHSEGQYGWLTDDDYTPDGSTILRAIKKSSSSENSGSEFAPQEYLTEHNELPDIAAIRDAAVTAFDLGTRNIISSINGDTPFSDRETIAAIDITYEQIYIPPWEDREEKIPNEGFPKMASGYKKENDPDDDDKKKGIVYGYKYATITLVGDNVPIILGVEPVKENSVWESDDAVSYPLHTIVDRLIAKAERFVNIDTVLFDRAFYSHKVFNAVAERDITYITPKKKYLEDLENIDDIETHPTANVAVQHDVTSGDGERSHEVNFLYVPSREEEGKYAVFATNQHVEPKEIKHVVNKYDRRWDIENEYKSVKDFKPRTSSMDYRVRFTIMVFATLIYNLWRLTDYLIKRAMGVPIRDDPIITSRNFARFVGNFLREVG